MKKLIFILSACLLGVSSLFSQGFWEPSGNSFGRSVFALAVNSDDYIFAGTNGGGVYRSLDNGNSWMPVNIGLGDTIRVNALAINSLGHVFAGTYNNGIYRSVDNGDTWGQINNGLTNLGVWTLVISSSDCIFAGTNGGGIYRSIDNGDNWIQVNNGLTAYNYVVRTLAVTSGSTTSLDIVWAVDNTGSMGGVIAQVRDNMHVFIDSLARTEADYRLGLVEFWDNVVFPFGTEFTTSASEFQSWVNTMGASGGDDIPEVSLDAIADAIRNMNWRPGARRVIIMVTDAPYHYSSDGFSFSDETMSGVIDLAVSNGATVFILTLTEIFDIYSPLTSATNGRYYDISGDYTAIFASIISELRAGLFAGAWFWGGIFRSLDNGDSWTQINNGLTNTNIQSLVISPGGYLFVGTDGGGIFRSIDGGNNWTQINRGLTYPSISVLAINSVGNIFAGTNYGNGVFRSTDNGDNWTQISSGLTGFTVYTFTFDSRGHTFAGTNGGNLRSSVFKFCPGSLRIEENTNPEQLLLQNHPNPFNTSMSINYSVPHTCNVLLNVYDVIGNLITTLEQGNKQSGNYSAQWDASDMPSGMYFIYLQAGNQSLVKQALFIK